MASKDIPYASVNPMNTSVYNLSSIRDQKVLKLAPDVFAIFTDSSRSMVSTFNISDQNGEVVDPEKVLGSLIEKRSEFTYYKSGVNTIEVTCSVSAGNSSASISITCPYYESNESYFFTTSEGTREHPFHSMQEVQIFAKGRFLRDGIKTNEDGEEVSRDQAPVYYRIFWGYVNQISSTLNGSVANIELMCSDLLTFWAYEYMNVAASVDIFSFALAQDKDGQIRAVAPSSNGAFSALAGMNAWEIVATMFMNPKVYGEEKKAFQIRAPETRDLDTALITTIQAVQEAESYRSDLSTAMSFWQSRVSSLYKNGNKEYLLPRFLELRGVYGHAMKESTAEKNLKDRVVSFYNEEGVDILASYVSSATERQESATETADMEEASQTANVAREIADRRLVVQDLMGLWPVKDNENESDRTSFYRLRMSYLNPVKPEEGETQTQAPALDGESTPEEQRARNYTSARELLVISADTLARQVGLLREMDVFEAYQPYTNITSSIMNKPEFVSRLDIVKNCAEKVGFEFFQDVNGKVVFKPPFFNMDTTHNPYYTIMQHDVISLTENTEAESTINYLEVTMPADSVNLNIYSGSGLYYDVPSISKYGLRSAVIEMPVAMTKQIQADAESVMNALDTIAAVHCSLINADITTGMLTIPLRPELRLGYPVYIEHIDSFYYVTQLSHSFSSDGEAKTSLTMNAKRERARWYSYPDANGGRARRSAPYGHRPAKNAQDIVTSGSLFKEKDLSISGLEPLQDDDIMYGFVMVQNPRETLASNLSTSKSAVETYSRDHETARDLVIKGNVSYTDAQEQTFGQIAWSNQVKYQEWGRQKAFDMGLYNTLFTPKFYRAANLFSTNADPESNDPQQRAEASAAASGASIVNNSFREFALMRFTKWTRPFTDRSGFRHVGGMPFGANLTLMKGKNTGYKDRYNQIAPNLDDLIYASPYKAKE